MVGSTISFELTEDGIEFSIFETKAWGADDVRRKVVIKFSEIRALSSGSEYLDRDSYDLTHLFWIPHNACWIGFHLVSTAEYPVGPMDETFHGPCLVEGIKRNGSGMVETDKRKLKLSDLEPIPFDDDED